MASVNSRVFRYRVPQIYQSTCQNSRTVYGKFTRNMSEQLEIVCLPNQIVAGRAFPCPIVIRFPTTALGREYHALLAVYHLDTYEDEVQHTAMDHGPVFEGVEFGNCRLDASDGFTYVIIYDPAFLNMTRITDDARAGTFKLLFKVEATPRGTGVPEVLGYVASHRIRVVRPDNAGFQEPWVYETAQLMNGSSCASEKVSRADKAKKHGKNGRRFTLRSVATTGWRLFLIVTTLTLNSKRRNLEKHGGALEATGPRSRASSCNLS